MVNYLAFGCWNKIRNEDDTIQQVFFHNLKSKIGELEELDFMAILGDNYYPEKKKRDGKKIKIYNEANLFQGFRYLNEIERINKIFIHGNHDIKDFKECQLTGMLSEKTGVFDPLHSVYPNELHIERGNTLMFFLDSTVYEFDDSIEISSTCYKKVFEQYPDLKTIGDIKKFQIDYAIDKLSKSSGITNIIFHFHHPIFARRLKDDKVKIDYNRDLREFYNIISEYLRGKNIYHVCADSHLYEEGVLSFNGLTVNQYIVGTGGADLDTPIPVDGRLVNIDGIDYDIKSNNNNYGVLHISSSINATLNFDFIPIDSSIAERPEAELKYLKYKMKYLTLKNKLK